MVELVVADPPRSGCVGAEATVGMVFRPRL